MLGSQSICIDERLGAKVQKNYLYDAMVITRCSRVSNFVRYLIFSLIFQRGKGILSSSAHTRCKPQQLTWTRGYTNQIVWMRFY
jgi:hypothetical protein